MSAIARPAALSQRHRGIALKGAAAMNTLARHLRREDICLGLDAADKAALLDAIGERMDQRHALPRAGVVAGLSRRELLGSTALGHGFAIPHCRVTGLDHILAAFLRLRRPIPFDAPDGAPVSDVLVLLVPKQAAEEHLTVLADAARLFDDPGFRAALGRCGDAMAVKRLFDTWA